MSQIWKRPGIRKARERFGKFGKNENGAVAIIVSVALPAMLLMAGGAADYARFLAARSKLQAAVDSATLATYAYFNKNGSITQADLRRYFDHHLKASLDSRLEQLLAIKEKRIHLDRTDRHLQVSVVADFPTTFIRLAGLDSMSIGVKSAAKAAIGRTEVALVLDTTGSMQGRKMRELKRAAAKFLDTIHARLPDDPNAFKVAIVPFAEYVNVGRKYRHASWIKVDPDVTARKSVRYKHCPGKWVCHKRKWRTWKHCWWEGNPDSPNRRRKCTWKSGWKCVKSEYVKTGKCYWTTWNPSAKIRWEGCVGSREYPLNLKDEGYGGEKVPGVMNHPRRPSHPVTHYDGWYVNERNKCGTPLTPLTSLKDNLRRLKQKIRALKADGYTYIPSGLVWGWRVLSPGKPFDQGSSDSDVRKIIVLMTDGANTRAPDRRGDRLYRDHQEHNVAYANRMLTELCNNIKATNPATGKRNADIITITFEVRNRTIKSLLQGCSTLGSYDVKSGQLEKVFEKIATDLVDLHLTE